MAKPHKYKCPVCDGTGVVWGPEPRDRTVGRGDRCGVSIEREALRFGESESVVSALRPLGALFSVEEQADD